MSKAYICDKCGKIIDVRGICDVGVHCIWTTAPFMAGDEEFDFHLCAECYAQFESEYLANLIESGGAE